MFLFSRSRRGGPSRPAGRSYLSVPRAGLILLVVTSACARASVREHSAAPHESPAVVAESALGVEFVPEAAPPLLAGCDKRWHDAYCDERGCASRVIGTIRGPHPKRAPPSVGTLLTLGPLPKARVEIALATARAKLVACSEASGVLPGLARFEVAHDGALLAWTVEPSLGMITLVPDDLSSRLRRVFESFHLTSSGAESACVDVFLDLRR